MKSEKDKIFRIVLGVFTTFYLIQYAAISVGIGYIDYSVYFDVAVFFLLFFFYILIYRKDSILCFEIMAIPIAFLGLFFADVVLENISEYYDLFSISSHETQIKSDRLQMLAWLVFYWGCIIGNKPVKERHIHKVTNYRINYGSFVNFLGVIILLLIIYDYRTGVFQSWFFYKNYQVMDIEERNQGVGHLTCLLVAASTVEIFRLRELGVKSIKKSILKINKLFLIELVLISVLLYLTGNRNEMLLVALPFVVLYSKCIKKIKNEVILVSFAIGVLLMVVAGTSRTNANVSIEGASFAALDFVRDFGSLGYCTDYLISYTDSHAPTYFVDLPNYVLPGIPFFGPAILRMSGYNGPVPSATLTAESVGSGTGIGTSLIGDLYYTAGFLWVIIFLFLLGYYMSRYYRTSNINIYLSMTYSYMVANAVYFVRSSWSFPITIILYVLIILFIGNQVFKVRVREKASSKES